MIPRKTPHALTFLILVLAAAGVARRWVRVWHAGRSNAPIASTIAAVQGASHVSPFRGRDVRALRGVVTAVDRQGFYLQDPLGDGDDATSDAIYVRTGVTPGVHPGDAVSVAGRVAEIYPDNYSSGGLSVTTIVRPHVQTPQVRTTSRASDPSSSLLTPRSRLSFRSALRPSGQPVPLTLEDDAHGRSVEDPRVRFDPMHDWLDRLESLESMTFRVHSSTVAGVRTIAGTIAICLCDDVDAGWRTSQGGVLARSDVAPVDLWVVAPASPAVTVPEADVGTRLEAFDAIVDYYRGRYRLLAIESVLIALPIEGAPVEGELHSSAPPGATPSSSSSSNRRALVKAPRSLPTPPPPRSTAPGELRVVSYNLYNLSPHDTDRLSRLARHIVDDLEAPDLLALQEIQDSSGPLNDSVVEASLTFDALTSAIETHDGPSYRALAIDPCDNCDGGPPGANIRVAYLYEPRRVELRDSLSADLAAELPSPPPRHRHIAAVRLFENSAAFRRSRKPLLAEFWFRGRPIIAINVHLRSKLGRAPLSGRVQPPPDVTLAPRRRQAEEIAALIDRLRRMDPPRDVIVLGDFNDDQASITLHTLTASGWLTNLTETLPEHGRYTYIHMGLAAAVDHILVSPSLSRRAVAAVHHLNCDFAARASDHDPVSVRFRLAP